MRRSRWTVLDIGGSATFVRDDGTLSRSLFRRGRQAARPAGRDTTVRADRPVRAMGPGETARRARDGRHVARPTARDLASRYDRAPQSSQPAANP
jgi:hypothetical protein